MKLQLKEFTLIVLKQCLFFDIFSYCSSCFKKENNLFFSCCISLPLCSFTFSGIEFLELNRIKMSVGLRVFLIFSVKWWMEHLLRFSFSFAENNKIGNVHCHVTGSHGEALYTDISSMVLIWNALMAGKNQSFHFVNYRFYHRVTNVAVIKLLFYIYM